MTEKHRVDHVTVEPHVVRSLDGAHVRCRGRIGTLAERGTVLVEWGTGRRIPVAGTVRIVSADYRKVAAKQRREAHDGR